MLFLEDLAYLVRDKKVLESAYKYKNDIINKIELTPSQNVLRFNYCFNSNLKFDGSAAHPSYLAQKTEALEGLKKELTFETKDDKDSEDKCLIQLNLSDSDEEDNGRNDNRLQTFTFNVSDEKDKNNNLARSIIQEEREEFIDSRQVTGENERSNSPVQKINLLQVSQSSPSLLSCNRVGNVFNLRSICNQSNMDKKEEKESEAPQGSSVFRPKRCRLESELRSEESTPQMNEELQEEESVEEKEIVPISPDVRMRRKRAQRGQKIANNSNMVLN